MDKDTFIAQNLFPKNLDAGKIRKPRLNVKSLDFSSSASRKTRLTLCILGSWAIYMPPYNIARLSALTREAGYYTRVFDFNVESHYDLKDANSDLTDAWNGANYWWWQEPEYYTRIHPTYEPILRRYIEEILEEESDIIGFSTYYTNFLATKWVVQEIKKLRPNVTIILGGPECHEGNFRKPQLVDYYFVGESEQNFLDFLNNWEEGIKPASDHIGSLYSDTRIDIDSLPYPDYSDFDLTKYWGKNSICAEISRGCVAKCTYCTEVYYWKFRDRGANTVVDEIEYQVKKYDIKFIQFVDSLMNGNLKEFRKFCQEIVDRNLNIQWWGYARADGRMDLDFYQLMADSGAQGFNYGFETGSDKVLKAINKKNTVAEINQNIIDSHKVGMKVSACWVIGAPGEDIEAFNHSFNLLWNHRKRIYAVSPGPGLGDNYGSAYDDREKFNINPRNKPWLGGWYTNDLTNTKLHRFIRIKLMHIWLYLCREFDGVLQNVHSVGDINDHFKVTFDSENTVVDEVEYETFDFNIIQSGLGLFEDSVMNEVFSLLRMLWRVKGGYEINIKFNEALDHKDFIFAIVPDTMQYDADIYFKIDEEGNYSIKNYYKFKNNFTNIIDKPGFEYIFESTGKWTISKRARMNKVFVLKEDTGIRNALSIPGCFSSLSVADRLFIGKIARRLPPNSIVAETFAGMGGRASIFSEVPNISKIWTIKKFPSITIHEEFQSVRPWINDQLVDICKEINRPPEHGLKFVKDLEQHLINDPTGLDFFNHITGKNQKIFVIDDKDKVNDSLDLCMFADAEDLEIKLYFWGNKVKPNGFLMINMHQAKESEVPLIAEYNFEFLSKQDHIHLFKKLG